MARSDGASVDVLKSEKSRLPRCQRGARTVTTDGIAIEIMGQPREFPLRRNRSKLLRFGVQHTKAVNINAPMWQRHGVSQTNRAPDIGNGAKDAFAPAGRVTANPAG